MINILTFEININGPLKKYIFNLTDYYKSIDENNLITFILLVAQRHGPFDLKLTVDEINEKYVIYCKLNDSEYLSHLYDTINDRMIIDFLMKNVRFVKFRLGMKK